jgi:three-Cys-motif partner protein
MAINRMVTKSGDIPEPWRRSLDRLLGTPDWYDAFYRVEVSVNLFGEETERVVKATTDSIGKYLNHRLATVFHAVAKNPRVLKNSRNSPLYLLCFAAGNEKGAPIALRIAEHLLKLG